MSLANVATPLVDMPVFNISGLFGIGVLLFMIMINYHRIEERLVMTVGERAGKVLAVAPVLFCIGGGIMFLSRLIK